MTMTLSNSRLALVGLCAALAVVVVAEIARVMPRSDEPRDDRAVDVAKAVGQLAPPDIDANIAGILERPLFSASRAAPEKEVADDDADSDGDEPLDRRLSGVVIGPEGREALFQRSQDKSVAVNVGGKLDGWTVTEIESDHVVLSRDGKDQTIGLLDDKTAPHAPPRAPKPKVRTKPTGTPARPNFPGSAPGQVRPSFPVRPAVPVRPQAGRQASK